MVNHVFEQFGIVRKHKYTGEYILSFDEAIKIIQYINDHHVAVCLGGDVLDSDGSYRTPNWYYNPDKELSRAENIERSCQVAIEFLQRPYNRDRFSYIIVLHE